MISLVELRHNKDELVLEEMEAPWMKQMSLMMMKEFEP